MGMEEFDLDSVTEEATVTDEEFRKVLGENAMRPSLKAYGERDPACKEGLDYYLGRGTEQSYEKAFQIFSELASEGNAEAEFHLAICYLNGYGVSESKEDAAELMRMSAEKDFPEAEFELGLMYYSGYGVDESYELSERWLRMAWSHGLDRAKKDLIDKGMIEPVSDEEYAMLSIFS